MKRLARLVIVIVLLASAAMAVTPTAALAHDQSASYQAGLIDLMFVKHGLQYVNTKITTGNASYICAEAHFYYYNSAGSLISHVYTPGATCAISRSETDYPGPYEKTYAKRVCTRWYVTKPAVGWFPPGTLLCVRAPW
jgi:hypothetical protein